MNWLVNRLFLLKRPITAVLLPAIICALLLLAALFLYYLPAVDKNNRYVDETVAEIKLIDKSLKQQKQYRKQVALMEYKHAYFSSLSKQNKNQAALLRDLLEITNTGNKLLHASDNDDLILVVENSRQIGLYDFIDTLETRAYIDRVSISPAKSNTIRINLTLNPLAGVGQ